MPRTDVGAATRATYVAFAVNGFAFASWASRIPQVKERLGLDPSELGLLLLAIAAGAVIALPSSGPVVGRFGSRRAVAATAVLGGAGLVTVAAGYEIGVAPVAAGLFLFGMAFPLDLLPAPDHAHLYAVLHNWITRLVLFGLCVLALFHWAHRFRYTLYDGLQLKRYAVPIVALCYGGAVVGSVIAAALLLTV